MLPELSTRNCDLNCTHKKHRTPNSATRAAATASGNQKYLQFWFYLSQILVLELLANSTHSPCCVHPTGGTWVSSLALAAKEAGKVSVWQFRFPYRKQPSWGMENSSVDAEGYRGHCPQGNRVPIFSL